MPATICASTATMTTNGWIDVLDLAVDQEIALRGDLGARQVGAPVRLVAEDQAVAQAEVFGLQFAPGLGQVDADFLARVGQFLADFLVDAGGRAVAGIGRQRQCATKKGNGKDFLSFHGEHPICLGPAISFRRCRRAHQCLLRCWHRVQ